MAISKQDLAVLKVALRMEAAQFRKESKRVQKEVKGLRLDFGKFTKGLKAVAIAGISFSAAFGTARRAFGSLMEEMNKVESVQRMAERINATTEFVSAMQHHFTSAGATVEQVNTVFQRLTKRMGQAMTGNAEARKAFAGLNVEWEKLAGLNTDQQLFAIFKAMQATAQGAEQVALAVGLGDTEIGYLIAGIQSLGYSMEDTIEIARSMGAVISEDMGKSAIEFNQILKDMTALWDGLKRSIAAWVASSPGVVQLLQEWRLALQGEGGGAVLPSNFGRGDPEELRAERDRIRKTLEKRGDGSFWTTMGAPTEELKKRLHEITVQLNYMRTQEGKARRERKEAAEEAAEAEKERLVTLKEEARVEKELVALRARIAAGKEAEADKAAQKELDAWWGKRLIDNAKDAMRQIAAPSAAGVGAATLGTVGGFSAVQSSFRAQQEQQFLDRTRNELLADLNEKLEEANQDRVLIAEIM